MTLSIITINYNNRDGLQRTIDSVICQTWKDYEWIVIDGGSTDGSKELIEQNQEHFAYWCSEPDRGVYHAMNKGIAMAHGDYLNFMNSGDVFYDGNVLESVFSLSLKADIIYGDLYNVSEKGELQFMKGPSRVSLNHFYHFNICHQAMFIKSSLLKKEGYDEDYHIFADWAKWLRLCMEGASFRYVPIVICKFYVGGLSSKRTQEYDEEMERIHKIVPFYLRVYFDKKDALLKRLFLWRQKIRHITDVTA